MDPAQVSKFINVLQAAQRYNLRDPSQLEKAKKTLQMANQLRSMPNLPQNLNAELIRFYDTVGARPEVAGIKTTITGNKWEDKIGIQSPFTRLK